MDDDDNFPASTQAASKSSVVYNWVFLFMYSPDVEFPFSSVNVQELSKTNFPFDHVDGPLDDKSRMTPFELFPSQHYCLFAKVEKGNFNFVKRTPN